MNARARTYIDKIIGGAHRVLVVFDNDKRVAQVAQFFQSVYQFFVVALVKSYARLVKDIKHPDKRRTYLRGKTYSLRFAARKR